MRAILIVIAMIALGVAPVAAASRVALVIGNGAYQHAARLTNPANDAAAIATTLEGMGFEVIRGIDLDEARMERTIRRFAAAVQSADLALFYYSGHGLQVDGKNYLIPVDADISDRASLDFDAIDADQLLGYMADGNRVALAFLDACRDNPFGRGLVATRGAPARGLALPVTSGSGLFIGFATSPNDVAADGAGKFSPFTAAMLKYLPTPGLEINQLMTRVKAQVRQATGGAQRPWSNSDLAADVILVPAGEANLRPEPTEEVVAPKPLDDALTDEVGFPAYIQLSSDPSESGALSRVKNLERKLGSLVVPGAQRVIRVDLGTRGLWYRVVLPLTSFRAATQICAQLQVTGTKCVAINQPAM